VWAVTFLQLAWTPCLMHRCVYLTVHITKLQLQTTFPKPLYIPHSACIHWDPGCWKFWCLHCLWLVRYQHTADHGKRLEMTNIPSVVQCQTPLGLGMPFLDINTCAGRVIYFCKGFLPRMMPSMDGWRNEWMDGRIMWWKKLHEKRPQRPLLFLQ
jgi:hypothetical protein